MIDLLWILGFLRFNLSCLFQSFCLLLKKQQIHLNSWFFIFSLGLFSLSFHYFPQFNWIPSFFFFKIFQRNILMIIYNKLALFFKWEISFNDKWYDLLFLWWKIRSSIIPIIIVLKKSNYSLRSPSQKNSQIFGFYYYKKKFQFFRSMLSCFLKAQIEQLYVSDQ